MWALNLVFALLLQTPAVAPPATASVVVGLVSGQNLVIDNPKFAGFIETRDSGETVLIYRQKEFRGELKLNTVQRIDFGYKRGKPFPLSVTLKNGKKLDLESDRRDFVTVKGATDSGSVTVNHPEPLSPVVHFGSKAPNRKKNLTIQYLEFPR